LSPALREDFSLPSRLLRCPQDHYWEDTGDGTEHVAERVAACPVCGAASVPVLISQSSPFLGGPAPQAAPALAAAGPAATVVTDPGSSKPAPGATVCSPAEGTLAGTDPPAAGAGAVQDLGFAVASRAGLALTPTGRTLLDGLAAPAVPLLRQPT